MKLVITAAIFILLSINSVASALPDKYCGVPVKVIQPENQKGMIYYFIGFEDGIELPMVKNFITLNALFTAISSKNLSLCLKKGKFDGYEFFSVEAKP